MRSRVTLFAVVALVAAPGVSAADKPADPREQAVERFKDEWTAEQRRAFSRLADEYAPRAFALVAEHPGDDRGFDILSHLIAHAWPEDGGPKCMPQLFRLLADHYATGKRTETLLATAPDLARFPSGKVFFEKVLADHPSRRAKALAALALAQIGAVAYAAEGGAVRPLDAREHAERLFNKVGEEYPDVTLGPVRDRYPAGSVSERASAMFTESCELAVGQPFPEVTGRTLAGDPDLLAGYRGKVVVVDVWATWCGPCVKMIPHERELVARHRDEPFAFVSVAADADKGKVEEFLKTTAMPWVHWWGAADGKKLLTQLNVTALPTVYVLDHRGVVRYKNVRGAKLDAAVEQCLAELKAAKP